MFRHYCNRSLRIIHLGFLIAGYLFAYKRDRTVGGRCYSDEIFSLAIRCGYAYARRALENLCQTKSYATCRPCHPEQIYRCVRYHNQSMADAGNFEFLSQYTLKIFGVWLFNNITRRIFAWRSEQDQQWSYFCA